MWANLNNNRLFRINVSLALFLVKAADCTLNRDAPWWSEAVTTIIVSVGIIKANPLVGHILLFICRCCCILFHACSDPPRLFPPQMFVHLHPITASLINCAAWTLCIIFYIYCCLQRLTNYRVHPPTSCCVLLFCSRAGLQLPLIIPLICRVRACSQASEGSGDM